MKKPLSIFLTALPLMLSSCATPPPQVFHSTDHSALVVESIDTHSCQIIAPTATSREENAAVLTQAKAFSQRQTAVVILENYSEMEIGAEFRDRTMEWFLNLRGLGFRHIVFLRGNGGANPDGLITLADYD